MVNIVTTFIADIEKAFRGHLPQNCINILAMMAEQQLMLEKALNEQQAILLQVAQNLAISAQADAAMLKVIQKHNQKFDDPHKDFIRNEEIKE